jgi:alkaline phosphatase D
MKTYGIDRRSFIQYMAGVSAIPTLALQTDGYVESSPTFSSNPFTLGVASGDPEPDGVVIWTRLSESPLIGESTLPSPVSVSWEVAHDRKFRKIVKKGTALAVPQLGHSVHVEVDGLAPNRWYFYRFHAGNESSPVGRTRTTPEYHVMPDRMRFAFTSCQHYESGYFNGYPHMQQEDLDLVIHLGDYIYEYAGIDNRVRKHLGNEITTLANYRQRYSQYRLDQSLQDAHRLFPWLVTWDDHEFDNNYANLVSEEDGISPEAFLARRMNAYQAYYEFMPLRRSAFPQGPHMKLYRSVRYGRLADFFVLDTRQYRTDQPNGDGQKPKNGKAIDPNGKLLGDEQEHWLMSGLTRSKATWNILAQQIMMADLNRGDENEARYSMDQWPGYEISRKRLLQFFHDRQIPNPVVLTGDIHVNWVNDLLLDSTADNSPVVGTEFVGSSMSSSGNGGNFIAEYERAAQQNDFVKWYNSNRGYVSCDLTPNNWTSHFRVTPFVDKPDAPLIKKASFVVEAGRPGANPA